MKIFGICHFLKLYRKHYLHYFIFNIGRKSAIIQLSAVCEDQIFNSYITPTQDISEEASRVTGIQFNAATNELLHDNKPVSHRHPLNVLLDFIQF